MTSKEYLEWLKTLTTGSEYIARVSNRWYPADITKVIITRATDKSIYIRDQRYLRSSGKLIGSSGYLAEPATQDLIDTVKLKNSIYKIEKLIDTNKPKITQEQADKILDVLSVFKT